MNKSIYNDIGVNSGSELISEEEGIDSHLLIILLVFSMENGDSPNKTQDKNVMASIPEGCLKDIG